MSQQPEVRLVELKPSRVASFRAVGKYPESKALDAIGAWAAENGFENREKNRIFGFDNPGPTPGKDTYGYEVWLTVGSDAEESNGITLRDFSGGLYAVVKTRLPDIGDSWKYLVRWCKSSQYREDDRQCLEEHVSPPGTPLDSFVLDLYLPVEKQD